MFCIIPVHGMEFRFSWQLASIWLGGIAFCAFLSCWWLRAFFLLALIRTATIEPVMDAYISLLMIVIFLAAAEGFKRIDERKIMACMCIAAGFLLVWIGAQESGILSAPERGDIIIGPFNRDAAGVFLALTLPAFFTGKQWYGIPFIFLGIAVIGTSTGFIAAIAATITAGLLCKKLKTKVKIIAMVIICIVVGAWFWKIDPVQNIIEHDHWTVWKIATRSMRSEMLGRGLGSWKVQFPLLASGEEQLGSVTNENGKITMSNIYSQAHNEYVHAGFELGAQTVLLIGAFLTWAAITICRGRLPAYISGGMVALSVSCFGWHVFHIAPLALLGCAWLGIFMRKTCAKS